MNYFVFRINYEGHYQTIRHELLDGRLRQGWGAAGMSVGDGTDEGSFAEAWDAAWAGEGAAGSNFAARRYRNLSLMRQMQLGDILVIPKVSIKREDGWRYFTIARCTGAYDFRPLECNDFGHIIPVETVASFSYDHPIARAVTGKFRCYQSPVNRVWNEEWIESINLLLREYEDDPAGCENETVSSLAALSTAAREKTDAYLDALIGIINSWSPSQLEHIIEDLFARNGYEKIGNNHYNRTGGDIDLIFSAYPADTLMGSVTSIGGDIPLPEIRVQAKNKRGQDRNDIKGVNQLLEMPGKENAINILINTAPDFSDDARQAAEKNVILINGRQFASLLLKFGMDLVDGDLEFGLK